jgi:hypothetical protein
MVSSGLLRRVALVRTNVSEEPGASFMRHSSCFEKESFTLFEDVHTSHAPRYGKDSLMTGSSFQYCLEMQVVSRARGINH